MLVKALVIVPTYNEVENVHALLSHVFSLKEAFHVLVVDDSSPDGTAAAVKHLQATYGQRLHLIQFRHKGGIRRAYLQGFRYALARDYAYILQMDADFSHDPADLSRLLATCATDGYDVAIGSRYISGTNVVNWPMKRVLISYFASRYVRFITGIPVYDTTAGFICYRRKVLELIDFSRLHFVGYAFQVAIKHRIWKHGGRLKEIAIIFRNRTRGDSKMSLSIFREAFFGVLLLFLQGMMEKYPPMTDTDTQHLPKTQSR